MIKLSGQHEIDCLISLPEELDLYEVAHEILSYVEIDDLVSARAYVEANCDNIILGEDDLTYIYASLVLGENNG